MHEQNMRFLKQIKTELNRTKDANIIKNEEVSLTATTSISQGWKSIDANKHQV